MTKKVTDPEYGMLNGGPLFNLPDASLKSMPNNPESQIRGPVLKLIAARKIREIINSDYVNYLNDPILYSQLEHKVRKILRDVYQAGNNSHDETEDFRDHPAWQLAITDESLYPESD